ncbi:AMP-binding enzyme family protein [Mycobacterium xenopi 4042]|uniref:AMP-binding enzyme family protein n=1 Tax=Mycobacterium xenopi 4042 TaxID=1299334 RepID=X8DCZ1_MYCXE|nr:AMP-binding enzyme family protein [Mycobacterium xenopi 4042]
MSCRPISPPYYRRWVRARLRSWSPRPRRRYPLDLLHIWATGRPKAVRHSDATLLTAARGYTAHLGLGSKRDELGTIAFPIAHIGGIVYLASALLADFPVLMMPKFAPEHLAGCSPNTGSRSPVPALPLPDDAVGAARQRTQRTCGALAADADRRWRRLPSRVAQAGSPTSRHSDRARIRDD